MAATRPELFKHTQAREGQPGSKTHLRSGGTTWQQHLRSPSCTPQPGRDNLAAKLSEYAMRGRVGWVFHPIYIYIYIYSASVCHRSNLRQKKKRKREKLVGSSWLAVCRRSNIKRLVWADGLLSLPREWHTLQSLSGCALVCRRSNLRLKKTIVSTHRKITHATCCSRSNLGQPMAAGRTLCLRPPTCVVMLCLNVAMILILCVMLLICH
jgi:hypothetical protein